MMTIDIAVNGERIDHIEAINRGQIKDTELTRYEVRCDHGAFDTVHVRTRGAHVLTMMICAAHDVAQDDEKLRSVKRHPANPVRLIAVPPEDAS